jgi:hypothetical protein
MSTKSSRLCYARSRYSLAMLPLFLLTSPIAAQSSNKAVPLGPVEVGFDGFEWRVSPGQVKLRRGAPASDTVITNMWRRLGYEVTLFGQPTTVYYFFTLDPDTVLLSGLYRVSFPRGRCTDVIEDIRDAVSKQNPRLQRKEEKELEKRLCSSSPALLAKWFINWGEESQPNVSLMHMSAWEEISVSFDGPRNDQYQKRMRESHPVITGFAGIPLGQYIGGD